MADLPILSIITLAPAAVALLLTLVPREHTQAAKTAAVGTMVAVLGLTAWLWGAYDAARPGLQFVENHAWIPAMNIRYHLGIDGLALAMMLLTAVTTPLAALCSWNAITKDAKGFFIALLALETGMMGVFSAADLFLFYIYWEVMLLPMALMIGIWGGARRVYAAVKFVLYTMAGSLLMFVAMIYSYFAAGKVAAPTFDIATLQSVLPLALSPEVQVWLFLAFALSFAIKVPVFPFHTWLPDAHVEAPTAGSVILAGVLLKMGGYGFLRFAIPFYPAAAQQFAPAMMALAAIGIVFGSLMSMVQTDIKKLVAYSSVAHLGYVVLGLFSGNVAAAQGGVLQMVNHGISTGALFLLVGVIYERTHTRGVKDFGGLAKVTPIYAVLFLIVTLSSIGLPGTNGFVGEFLILAGAFQTYPVYAAIGGLGVILGAVYMLTLYRNMFFGPVNPKYADLTEPTPLELTTLVPLIALIFFLGFLPNTVLEKTEGSVAHVMQVFQPKSSLGKLDDVHAR
jgi:NADH-quinone oxidoreductase subunit M